MSPEIIRSKLLLLREVLSDLKPNVMATREEQKEAHYEIERQVQLAVDFSLAIARRLLVLKNLEVPETNREVFIKLSESNIIPKLFSKQLADASGLRNLLVHEYGKIDYDLFFNGLKDGYKSLLDFSKLAAKYIETK